MSNAFYLKTTALKEICGDYDGYDIEKSLARACREIKFFKNKTN